MKEMPATTKPTSGRPRSEAARRAILDATFDKLTHTNVRDLSIEAIASAAGVGRATIYRWWPNKAALMVDAVTERHLPRTPMASKGSAGAALTAHLVLLVDYYAGEP